jgi:hypothetical protein
MLWRESLEGDARFGPLEASQWPHERVLSADEYVAMIASWSIVAGLEPAERARTLVELRQVLAANGLGELVERLQTELYVSRLNEVDE